MATTDDKDVIDLLAIAALVALYLKAAKDTQDLVRAAILADLTVSAIRTAQGRVGARVGQLQMEAQGWAQQNVTAAYNQGRDDAVSQLQAFNHPLATAAATAIATSLTMKSMSAEAAATLAQGMATRLDQASAQLLRSATTTLGDALRQAVRDRIAASGDVATVDTGVLKREILKKLDKLDINVLTDASGKRWAADTYADMLSRTTLMQARNQALADSLAGVGFDLVQVSAHGAKDVCGPWEGRILSMNGAVSGYPTVEDATADGLFHPNCLHTLSAVSPDEYPKNYWTGTAIAAAAGYMVANSSNNAPQS